MSARLLVVGCLVANCSSLLHGDTLPQFQQDLEALMDAQGANATLIGRLFGPDSGSVLPFSSNIDALAGRFSYTQMLGATYLGQPVSSQGSGTVDAGTNSWTMSASGSLGVASWSGTGSGNISADPTFSFQWNWVVNLPGSQLLLDYLMVVQVTAVTGILESEETATYTVAGKPVAFARGTDFVSGPVWTWNLSDNAQIGLAVASAGLQPEDGQPGSFTTTIVASSEPPGPTTLFLGLLALFTGRQVRRHRGRVVAPSTTGRASG
jgi:hypothetical protein